MYLSRYQSRLSIDDRADIRMVFRVCVTKSLKRRVIIVSPIAFPTRLHVVTTDANSIFVRMVVSRFRD
jgi:hypothetical protein